jgi:hypothetical protein
VFNIGLFILLLLSWLVGFVTGQFYQELRTILKKHKENKNDPS